MKNISVFFISLLANSAFASPIDLKARGLQACRECMTEKLHHVGIIYGTTYIDLSDMHKWSTVGASCSLEGKCAKGAPVSDSGSGSDSGGDHKPKTKPSEVMQLAAELRKSKKMVKQTGGASNKSY